MVALFLAFVLIHSSTQMDARLSKLEGQAQSQKIEQAAQK